MRFLDRMRADAGRRYAADRAARPADRDKAPIAAGDRGGEPPGGFSLGTTSYGGPVTTDAFGARRAPSPWQLIEKYKSIVYAMVARKRDGVSKVPLRLYADSSRRVLGGRVRSACDPIEVCRSAAMRHVRAGVISGAAVDRVVEVRAHPFLETLDNPDGRGYFTRKKLLGLLTAYQDVVGSGYLVPEGNGWDWKDRDRARRRGPPEYLHVIYPQYVIPVREAGSPLIRDWQYLRDRIPFEAAIWFRHSISLRDAYGSSYSPLYAGDVYADQEDRQMAILDQILGLGPRPNMIATAKDPMNPPGEVERRRFAQDMVRTQAAGNAGGVLVNTGAWEFTPVSYSPADMAGKEVSEYDRTNLACIFGLPPTYFTTESNLANLEAADAFFARFGIEPMCASIAETLTWIVRRWDPRLYFMFDPVLAEDELRKAQVDKIYFEMGCRTPNQITQEMKYPPTEAGEHVFFNKNLVTWEMMQEQHRQGLAAAQAGIEQANAGIELKKKEVEYATAPDEPDPAEGEAAEEARALTMRLRELAGEVRRGLSA